MENKINKSNLNLYPLNNGKSQIQPLKVNYERIPVTENYQNIMKRSLENNFNSLQEIVANILCEFNNLEKNSSEVFNANFNLSEEVKNYETHLIKLALKICQGRQTKAAKILGIKKTTLNAKIHKYQLFSEI